MAVIDRVLIGEGLVIEERPEGGLDLKNVAHIDLIMGPRGSAAEDAFCRTLTDQKQGVNGLLAIAAPNMMVKPNTVMFNKVTIKDGRQATQMFGPAQRGVAMAVMDCVADGTIPLEEADDVFICVGVFIDSKADMDDRIQDWNYRATKMAIKAAVAREPKAADVVKQYKEALHPFAAQTPEAQNRRAEDKAAALAISQMQERSKHAKSSYETQVKDNQQVDLAISQMRERINTTRA
ncbi:formaldehyde-activating enzyme [Methylophilus glucosoxydans]|uniref:Formaldehyde-activating enzyme n=1 Tax=Methylophilus glucosoxydans TaxID=752553 RepID=A0ABW3GNH6_9PROT|nr:formaldehyde-activating enzyme [Methylophilus sp. VKM B-3414]MDT7850753.1 formaldehyde-activating enzyme [Methylophilus sp. VKM B-3414]BEV08133.1 formaldehyde-activating enzyme [Methylophilus sp. DW102]